MTKRELIESIYKMAAIVEGRVAGYKAVMEQKEITNEDAARMLDRIHERVMTELNKVEKSTLKKVG